MARSKSKLTAAANAAAGAAKAAPKRKTTAQKKPSGLDKINHIVVVMMENRSFDNLLGWLYHFEDQRKDQPKFEGLDWSIWNPLANIDADGNPFTEKVPIKMNGADTYDHYGKKVKNKPDWTLPNPDPGEGFKDTNHQLYRTYQVDSDYPPPPVNTGFVDNYNNTMLYAAMQYGDKPTNPREIMTTYTPDQVPVLSGLARHFAVCDQYFCSLPSQTLPNRDFVHAATSTGFVNNGPHSICDAKTIFNQIQDEIDTNDRTDLGWRVYCGTNWKGQVNSLTRSIMSQLDDPKFDDNFRLIDQFHKDAKNGDLPSYTFIEPQFSGDGKNDQHPPQDIRPGEVFMNDLYNSIVDSKKWDETLFIITYDEHGGCFDHFPPPGGAKNPDPNNMPGQMGFMFNRFGVRVPTVLISPYIDKGIIHRSSSTPFDHTSIIRTVQECFNLKGHLTARDEAAESFANVLTLGKPRTDKPRFKPHRPDSYQDVDEVNGLHREWADALHQRTGKERSKERNIHRYIGESYAKHFKSSKKN